MALTMKPASRGGEGARDFGRRYANSIAFLKDLVCADGLAIDADEIVLGLAARQALREELSDSGFRGDVDVVRETATVF